MKLRNALIGLFCLTLMCGLKVRAQDYHHAIGFGVNIYQFSATIPEIKNDLVQSPEVRIKGTTIAPNILYVPRLNFKITKQKSFSLISYTNMGLGIASSSVSFMAGIPVYAQMNWGLDSQIRKKPRGKKGFYLGLGYDTNFLFGSNSTVLHGPSLVSGIKFKAHKKAFGIGLNYTYVLGSDREGTIDNSSLFIGVKTFMRLIK